MAHFYIRTHLINSRNSEMCTFNLAKKHEMKLFTTCWVTTISLSLNLLQSWPKMKHWGIHNKQVPWDILTKVEFDLMPLLSPLSPASIPPWLSAVGRPLKRQASCSTAMNGMLRLYQWKINDIQKKHDDTAGHWACNQSQRIMFSKIKL